MSLAGSVGTDEGYFESGLGAKRAPAVRSRDRAVGESSSDVQPWRLADAARDVRSACLATRTAPFANSTDNPAKNSVTGRTTTSSLIHFDSPDSVADNLPYVSL